MVDAEVEREGKKTLGPKLFVADCCGFDHSCTLPPIRCPATLESPSQTGSVVTTSLLHAFDFVKDEARPRFDR